VYPEGRVIGAAASVAADGFAVKIESGGRRSRP
jgi:hypothetical protein